MNTDDETVTLEGKPSSRTVSFRLTREEHKTLMVRAFKKDMSLSEYVKWILFRKHEV